MPEAQGSATPFVYGGIDGLSIRALEEPKLERTIFSAVRKGSGKSPGIAAVLDALAEVRG